MNDIEMHMIEWGRWAQQHSKIDYTYIKQKLNGFIHHKEKTTDNIKLEHIEYIKIIDHAVHYMRNSNEFQVIVLHYIYRLSKRQISRILGVTEGLIRYELRMVECFICGLLFERVKIPSITKSRLKEKKRISVRY